MATASLSTVFNYLAAAFAFMAAIFWFRSSTASVKHEEKPDETGIIPASITVDGEDFIATTLLQSKISKQAAVWAAIAALFQSAALLLPSIKCN